MTETDALAVTTRSAFYAESSEWGSTVLRGDLLVLRVVRSVIVLRRERGVGQGDGKSHFFEGSEAVVVVHRAVVLMVVVESSVFFLLLLLSFAF